MTAEEKWILKHRAVFSAHARAGYAEHGRGLIWADVRPGETYDTTIRYVPVSEFSSDPEGMEKSLAARCGTYDPERQMVIAVTVSGHWNAYLVELA